MSEANKAVVRRWMEEGFNKNDLSIADETFAENHLAISHVRGGKAVETWQNFDEVGMLKQIGAMPDAG